MSLLQRWWLTSWQQGLTRCARPGIDATSWLIAQWHICTSACHMCF